MNRLVVWSSRKPPSFLLVWCMVVPALLLGVAGIAFAEDPPDASVPTDSEFADVGPEVRHRFVATPAVALHRSVGAVHDLYAHPGLLLLESHAPSKSFLQSATISTRAADEGAGDATGPMADSFVLPDGTIDPFHAGYALAASGGLAPIHDALKDASGFLGASPDLGGALVVRAYFTGSAPVLPQGILPAGWSLEAVEHVHLEKAGARYDSVLDLTESRARNGPPLPAQAIGIGPGSHLLVQYRGESATYGCTANFVWNDTLTGDLYLGAAGHCFLPVGKTATHGPGADYNLADTTSIRVCVADCTNGGQLGFVLTGQTVELVVPDGGLAYARQNTAGSAVGHDFGLVKIPDAYRDLVRPEMSVWNGPQRIGTLGVGETALLYGNAGGVGEAWPTMARAGFGGAFGNADYWSAVLPSFQGDSGSALISGRATGDGDLVVGDEAIGALTHLSAGGPVVGTTVKRAKEMALEANLVIEVVLQGEDVAHDDPAAADAPTPVDVLAQTTSATRTSEPDGGDPVIE